MVVDDLDHVGGADTVHRLILLIVVHQNHLLPLHIQQVALGEHAHIVPGAVQHGEVAATQLGHGGAHVRHQIVVAEGNQAFGLHHMAHRNRLIDELGAGVGVQRGGDNGAARLSGQLLDGAGDLGAETYHDAARLHLNGAELAFVAVAQNHHVVFADIVLHHIGIGGGDDHLALSEVAVRVAHHQLAVQGIHNVPVAGSGVRQSVRPLILHIEPGDVAKGDNALELIVMVQHRQSGDIVVPHVFPCPLQGQVGGDAADLTVLDVMQPRLQRGHILGLLHAELVQHILGLRVHMPGTGGDILLPGEGALQVGVADGGADGVGVRVFMSDDDHWLHDTSLSFVHRIDGLLSISIPQRSPAFKKDLSLRHFYEQK